MPYARAAIAGAITMLLGIWVMTNDQSTWDPRDVVVAILAPLVIVLLLTGVDVRRGRWHTDTHDDDEEKKED